MLILTVFDGDEMLEDVELSGTPVSIGRDAGNDIVLPESSVSRQHAILEPQGNFYFIRDRGSANGTFLNNHQVKVHLLENEDVVQIGRYTLKVSEGRSGDTTGQPGGKKRQEAPRPSDEELVLEILEGDGEAPAKTQVVSSFGDEKNRLEELRRWIIASFATRMGSLLNPIEAKLAVLEPILDEDSEGAVVLGEVTQEFSLLREVAERFLDFARREVDAARRAGTSDETPLHPIIRKAIGFCQEEARARRILISDRFPGGLALVSACIDRLRDGLVSIVSSLVSLADEGAIILIEGRSEGDTVIVELSADEAPAIPGDLLLPSEPAGTGSTLPGVMRPGPLLGLLISRQIFLEHGGELRLVSPFRGKGRGIHLSAKLPAIPLAKAGTSPARAKHRPPAPD